MKKKKMKIVDGICGIGKTTAIINMIKEDKSDTKYIFITPFLSEVQRIKKSCPEHKFKEPLMDKRNTKSDNLKHLLKKGENIVSTHALFKRMWLNEIDLKMLNNYVLIMDEVFDVSEDIYITPDDLNLLLGNYIIENEDGFLEWIEPNYNGVFNNYKSLISGGNVFIHRSQDGEPLTLIWFFPTELFSSFKDVYVLTYIFGGQVQKYYYDLFGFEYENFYVKDFHLTSEKQTYDMSIKSKIKICNIRNLNKIGDDVFALSESWFQKGDIKTLKNNTYSFIRNHAQVKSSDVLWTTFKKYKNKVKGKGYSKSFAPLNMRATNEYKEKIAVAYIANRYFSPFLQNFFRAKGVSVNQDLFALSELVQFLFRSRIRDGKEIFVYIPSSRMRNLLEEWINSLQ